MSLSSLPLPSLVAHQGGWDEILFVAVPLVVFGGLLWLANKRADQHVDDSQMPNRHRDDPAGQSSDRDT